VVRFRIRRRWLIRWGMILIH